MHTKPRSEETVVAAEKPCDRFVHEMIEYTNSSAYKELFTNHSELIKNLEEIAGGPLKSLTSLNFVYDSLFIEKLKNMNMDPRAVEALKNKDFAYLAEFYFALFTQTDELKKLRAGFLLKEILDRSDNKTKSTLSPDRSLWMYFAHDNTLVDILNSLHLFDVNYLMDFGRKS